MSDLPEGWEWTTVGEAGKVSLGRQRAPKYHQGDNMRPYLRVANVLEDRIDASDIKTMHFSEEEFERYRLRGGDVLLNEGQSPEFLGRPAIYRGDPPDVAYTNSLIRFQAGPAVLPEWALIVFRRHMRSGRFMRESRITTNIAHLSASRLSSVEFPVPPLAEQKRIIAAVDEQFSRLDAGIAALERTRNKLGALRASCVNRAVDQALQHTMGESAPVAKLLELPLANGKSVPDGPLDGYPVLRLTAIRGQQVDVTQSKAGAWTAGEARPFRIREGDFLVARGNGTRSLVGRGCMVAANAEVAFPDTMIRMRFDKKLVIPEYAALMWNSGPVRIQIENSARTTAGIYKINQKDLQGIRFPVPDIEHQRMILESVVSAFDAIWPVESLVAAQLKRAEKVRSSILSTAFSGKLTSQGGLA